MPDHTAPDRRPSTSGAIAEYVLYLWTWTSLSCLMLIHLCLVEERQNGSGDITEASEAHA